MAANLLMTEALALVEKKMVRTLVHIHLLTKMRTKLRSHLLSHLAYRSLSTCSPALKSTQQCATIFQSNERITHLCSLGRVQDARKVFDEMPQRDAITWNSMIAGYTQNNQLDEAKSLFDTFTDKNVRTWTLMLTAYSRNGWMEEAGRVFELMPDQNVISWNAMISGFIENGDLCGARRIFDRMPERNVSSWNSIVTGYCHYCLVDDARELFDQMPERNSISWTVMIRGYVRISDYKEAWKLFLKMHRSGIGVEQSTFVVGVSALAGLDDFALMIGSLRTILIKTGFEGDVVVNTAVLDALTKNGSLDIALVFFKLMPELNEYSWTSMITALSKCGRFDDAIAFYERAPQTSVAIQTAILSAYAQSGRIEEARCIFDSIRKPNIVAWNAIVSGYAQNGMLEEAKNLFFRIPCRNAVSWGVMISGLVQNGQSEVALELLSILHRSGAVPSHSSFTSALSACCDIGALGIGRQIHTLSIKTGCQSNSYIQNGLISLYAKCRLIDDATRVFCGMRRRDIISWNSLIACFSENHMLDHARSTLTKMPYRDVVSWTTIISAYVQAGQGEVAFQLFLDMLADGVKPNEVTLTKILSLCEAQGTSEIGKQILSMIYKLGFHSSNCVFNSVIRMYFKCRLVDEFSVVSYSNEHDDDLWNAVLSGCVENGHSNNTVEVFKKIKGSSS